MEAVTHESIAALPRPVQRSLRRSGVVGREIPTTVTLSQRGEILLRDRWFPCAAEEDYHVDPPAFRWTGVVKGAGVPIARAEDSLDDGRGKIHVRLFGLVPVVDAAGPEMDQGALMRWLNETMWFPHVWATDLVSWTPIDDTSAAASVTARGVTVQAEFRFDDDGRLVDFRADRYRFIESAFELRPWATPLTAHARFSGVEVPSSGYALWELDDGDLEYIRIDITDIRYT
jgi:hypothetical protein